MKSLALILSILLLLITVADAAPIIFIVRHAEKASTGDKDPNLSSEGQKRANALAQILKDSYITSVLLPNSSERRKLGHRQREPRT